MHNGLTKYIYMDVYSHLQVYFNCLFPAQYVFMLMSTGSTETPHTLSYYNNEFQFNQGKGIKVVSKMVSWLVFNYQVDRYLHNKLQYSYVPSRLCGVWAAQ